MELRYEYGVVRRRTGADILRYTVTRHHVDGVHKLANEEQTVI
jgi:hypothetical protein